MYLRICTVVRTKVLAVKHKQDLLDDLRSDDFAGSAPGSEAIEDHECIFDRHCLFEVLRPKERGLSVFSRETNDLAI
jgi:hypothetical protein